ncbi:hypothetical protein, partial [Bathymodiolus platifrons methanotrophic gill symbiont]|uniref:hypothetical protein n=1 Tax=Bathymodiolus platifrons methanotrophic gill symbiont TaxID=113268 RepID=UPI001B7D8E0D
IRIVEKSVLTLWGAIDGTFMLENMVMIRRWIFQVSIFQSIGKEKGNLTSQGICFQRKGM